MADNNHVNHHDNLEQLKFDGFKQVYTSFMNFVNENDKSKTIAAILNLKENERTTFNKKTLSNALNDDGVKHIQTMLEELNENSVTISVGKIGLNQNEELFFEVKLRFKLEQNVMLAKNFGDDANALLQILESNMAGY